MLRKIYVLLLISSALYASADKKAAAIIASTLIKPKVVKLEGAGKFGPWVTYKFDDESMSCTHYTKTGEIVCARLVQAGSKIWGEHIAPSNFYQLAKLYDQQESAGRVLD